MNILHQCANSLSKPTLNTQFNGVLQLFRFFDTYDKQIKELDKIKLELNENIIETQEQLECYRNLLNKFNSSV